MVHGGNVGAGSGSGIGGTAQAAELELATPDPRGPGEEDAGEGEDGSDLQGSITSESDLARVGAAHSSGRSWQNLQQRFQ
eukprot:9055131-Prorocentrum_lima.AAC.1